jgi:hypothetical protein
MIMDGISFYPNFNLNTYAPASAGVTDVAKEGNIQGDPRAVENSGKTEGARECQTCKNRKYQDGSDEMVSFKSAQHIDPNAAAARVRGHEQEHVVNAYKEAEQDGGKVISCNVSIHTAICPECGRVYVSGGTASTKIAHPVEQKKNPLKDQMDQMAGNIARGLNMDMTA